MNAPSHSHGSGRHWASISFLRQNKISFRSKEIRNPRAVRGRDVCPCAQGVLDALLGCGSASTPALHRQPLHPLGADTSKLQHLGKSSEGFGGYVLSNWPKAAEEVGAWGLHRALPPSTNWKQEGFTSPLPAALLARLSPRPTERSWSD